MARKKKHPEHVNHERWLISYADFITLLFAFFVVLFSSSQVDKPKVGKIAKSVQVAFQDLGIFSASTTNVPISDDAPIPFNSVQSVEPSDHTGSLGKFVPKAKSKLGGKEEPESRVLHVTAFRDPMREMDKLHSLYDSLMDARRESGDDVVPFHRFAALVKDQVTKVKATGVPEVAFRVALIDGKVNFTVRGLKGEGGEE